MYLYHDLKMIYFRVPKTGTNSFWKSMDTKHKGEWPDGLVQFPHSKKWNDKKTEHKYISAKKMEPITMLAHFTARQGRVIVDEEIWNTYEKIGFIRHPHTWSISYYNQRGIKGVLSEDNDMPFPEFLKTMRMTPFSWFVDKDGTNLIDTVYRMEDFNDILTKTYGIDPEKCLHINKGHRQLKESTHIDLTNDDIEVIKTKFKREWEYY